MSMDAFNESIVLATFQHSLHGHSPGPRGPIDLDSFSRASAYQALFGPFPCLLVLMTAC